MASSALPVDFLRSPGPEVKKQLLDFKQINLSEYDGFYATILDNVFTESECDTLVRAAEERTNGVWEQAMVNTGGGRQALYTDVRDCGRIIWDDREIVERIWSRVKAYVPEIDSLQNMGRVTGIGPVKRKETWRISRLNERMRFLKYGKGQYFRPHCDGSFATPDNEEISFYTLHLYLNESSPNSSEGKLEGGATTFHSDDDRRSFDVLPKVGRVLIFQHRNLLHSGADVTGGTKLTLRTDVMFAKVPK